MGSKLQLLQMAANRIGVSPSSDIDEMDRITERRHRERPGGQQYAWCGDFASYILMLSGCHDGGALNRVALNGSWQPGDNIARLVRWAKGYNQFVSFADAEQGDIIIFANDTGDHICFLEQKADAGGIFYTIDGNHGNVVARAQRGVGNKTVRCCISTGMLIAQTAPTRTPEEWTPFPIPEIPDASKLPDVLPFPIGWHYSEKADGRIDWTGSPWLESYGGEKSFDGSQLTAIGRQFGMGIVASPSNLMALAGSLGIEIGFDTVVNMLRGLVKFNMPRISSPTDTIQLDVPYTDGVEELYNEYR